MKKSIFIGLLTIGSVHAGLFDHNNPVGLNYLTRISSANYMEHAAAYYDIAAEHNGDDLNVADYAGSFHKTLEHDATTGLLTANGKLNYEQLLVALTTNLQADFNAIQRAPGAKRKLVSPQGGFGLSILGLPSCLIPALPSPTLTSAHAAAEMIEVYLKAISRDVSFEDYGTGTGTDEDDVNGGSITDNAAAMINALGNAYKGPRDNGIVTAQTLFRGNSVGDRVGPYLSQFWYSSIHYVFLKNGSEFLFKVPVAQKREFGVKWSDFVDIENGLIPKPIAESDFVGTRYIINARDAATAVHLDGPGELIRYAIDALILANAPLAPNFPYYNGEMPNEGHFVNMFLPDIYAMLFEAAQEGLKHAWAHKWRASRRLRPETMAGLIHRAKITLNNSLGLHSSLFSELASINLLNWVRTRNQLQEAEISNSFNAGDAETYLLAQIYPEGSPIHPAYQSGHATFSGASATIAKAYFDDQKKLRDISGFQLVKPNVDGTALIALEEAEKTDITVGGELDKIASNIAAARDFAGVHYRSDGDEGLILGEQVAIRILQDRACTYTEQGFTGFELTKRDGQRIRITATEIINIS